ncbi:MAG: hypothetical protein ACOZEN_09840 [Thermodesulfobacteriota bacterium]
MKDAAGSAAPARSPFKAAGRIRPEAWVAGAFRMREGENVYYRGIRQVKKVNQNTTGTKARQRNPGIFAAPGEFTIWKHFFGVFR